MSLGAGGSSKAKAWRDIWGCGQGSNAIKDVLSQLSPSKVRIYHLSPDEKTDIDLKYADGAFRVEEISQQEINSWGDSEIAVLLPEPEIISLDDSEDKVVVSKEFETPQIVYVSDGVQAFLSQSKNHKNNKGIMQMKFMSPTSGKSAQIEAELSIIFYHFLYFQYLQMLLSKLV